MLTSLYEDAMFGRAVNENPRPPQPNAIEVMKKRLGRDHFTEEASGKRRILLNGKWTRPLGPEEFIFEGNRKLKSEGKPQVLNDPRWRAP